MILINFSLNQLFYPNFAASMDTNLKQNRPVVIWLFVGVAMIIVQVLLGGITRLTGSGLSITEWKLVLGALPPMNEADWQAAFDKYKEIGQFKYINNHFTLQDFKGIYFWEWLHRNWGRLIGIVFFVPFTYFVVTKRFKKDMINPMIGLFLLGGLQGAIGWIMVKSGINDEDLYVSHIRLAIHFIAALSCLVYTMWFALKLSTPAIQIQFAPNLKKLANWILAILTVQLAYGAFMAGLHAALAATTWPDINGQIVPTGMFTQGGFLEDITHNMISIQFIHRGLAYILTVLIIIWWVKAGKIAPGSTLHKMRSLTIAMVLLQVLLGVLTLLNSKVKIPLSYALAHQFVGMLLLMVMVWARFLVNKKTAQ
ncbi:cytochrome c oxidase assembly protein subunit 15 [Chitinophaga skermanii]|uniref:Cytochrome c oxidase assembly protein subunit 15 n=1 Tax=Chitinophaga skermanii TaxID=331697 RepID=A0A327Q4N8_9BACT|nr:COX15/CtaA family protein [Chitinophaga skermanii]RAI98737.1 cytochrome c oxidase assembly protein subunit 15 [Chitinophaga skermanii]